MILVNLQRAEAFGPGQNRSRSGRFEVPPRLIHCRVFVSAHPIRSSAPNSFQLTRPKGRPPPEGGGRRWPQGRRRRAACRRRAT
ncbi:hypothetical protein HMPREF0972_01440 [Actinomyces sp. oral taxon 848 str. F0332]|nr:hypothetical protein HMPREF0972_01440 [Actinomyces sp. oral taxon 848 str. F0332]